MDQEKFQIKWLAHEYEDKEKSTDWFWALGLLALGGVVVSIIFKNYLFAIFILLGGATMVMYSVRKPDLIEFEINDKGVRVKDLLYPFKNLKAFRIASDHEHKLLLESDRAFMPLIVIPLREDIIADAQNMLVRYLPEKDLVEPAPHRIMHFLGF